MLADGASLTATNLDFFYKFEIKKKLEHKKSLQVKRENTKLCTQNKIECF